MAFPRHPDNDKIVLRPVIDYSKQSVAVPGTKRPGQTAHYQNGVFGLIDLESPNVLTTLTEVFDNGLRLSKNRPFLGHRPVVSTNPLKFADHFVWQTYGEVDLRRRHLGSALHALFQSGELGGGEFETVGIWSQNRPEWQVIDIALQAYKKVGVSLYDTLGQDSVEYIIGHAHLTVIFATVDHIPNLLKLAPKTPSLKMIIAIDEVTPASYKILANWGETVKIKVVEMRELEAVGKANVIDVIPATHEQIATICYTSGTTSNPKGVVLKHKNLALATQSNLFGLTLPAHESCLMSYLPLAHIYERITELCTVAVGGRIGYFTGDPLRLLEDAQILKPNFFPSVPRVLNRVYQSAMVVANSGGVKGALFNKALQVKIDKLHATGDNTHILWDRLVFKKIQAVLGGNILLMVSGSAPISPDVMDFLNVAFACVVVEGYGMTENCATTTVGFPGDPSAGGTVGPPQPVNEIKLVDVPAMGYTSEDAPYPRGEICVRGVNCFSVYYKDEKNTKETVDSEGWMHTGDVGAIDSHGRLKVVDRVKNIMKLAQGEYVALEKVENLYSASPIVAQLFVHGDSLQSFLLAVVVPDPVQLSAAASDILGKKFKPEDTASLQAVLKEEKINEHVLKVLNKEAKRNGLKGFEMIKRIHLSLDPFTIENGTLTPTFKLRRRDAYNKFKAELDSLYALGEPSSNKL